MDGSELPVLDWLGTLSDINRVRALRVTEQQELSVAELGQVLQLPQPTVSHHLKVLSDDGWLEGRREGRNRFYRFGPDALGESQKRLWKFIRGQFDAEPSVASDDARLEQVLHERQTQSQAFFASSAGQWDRLRSEIFGERFEVAALAALLQPNSVVGDLGCGTGRISEVLAPFAERVVGIDGSAAMIRAAKQRLRSFESVELRRGTLEDLPLDDDELDLAMVVLVLHHVADPERALAEVARTLRPGGRIVIVDAEPHDREEYRQQMGHVWLGFEEAQLGGWLSSAGFASVRRVRLRPDPLAKGPPLFVCTAERHEHSKSWDPKQRDSKTRDIKTRDSKARLVKKENH